jgi:hypothetical protein
MTDYEVSTTTDSSSGKTPSSVGGLVLVKTSKPKSVNQVHDQTLFLFSTLVILSQDVKIPLVGDTSDSKFWVTLLTVFVYMEAFLRMVMYPGISVELLTLIRDDTFRHIRRLINDSLCKVSRRSFSVTLLSSLILGRTWAKRTIRRVSSTSLRRVGTTPPTTDLPFRLTVTVTFASSLSPLRTN